MNSPQATVFSAEVRDAMRRSVLCWLATVDEQGWPNVSPKEVFAPDGDNHLLIAHIASPGSVRNLRQQPQACVSFIDVFVQKGFKLRGHAQLISSDEPDFLERSAPLRALTQGRFPIHAIIDLQVQEITPIMAPSYRLCSNVTEADQISSAMVTYGVQPRTFSSPTNDKKTSP